MIGANFKTIGSTYNINVSIHAPVIGANTQLHHRYVLGGFNPRTCDRCECSNLGKLSNDYGIVIGNSQDISVNGGSYYARRHGTAIGGASDAGAIVNRNIKFYGVDVSNDLDSAVHAADMHGNTEFSGYENCNISGGTTYQGKNNYLRKNTISSMNIGVCVYAAEVLGGIADITDNTFECHANPQINGNRGVIDFGGNSEAINGNTTSDTILKVKGNTVRSVVFNASTAFVMMCNRGTAKKVNADVSDNTFEVNALGSALSMRKFAGATANSDYIIVDNNSVPIGVAPYSLYPDSLGAELAYHFLPALRLQSHNWTDTITTSTTVREMLGTPSNYKWKFPREPVVTAAPIKTGILGLGSLAAVSKGVSVSNGRLTLYSNTGNFETVAPIKVYGSAFIKEV